MKILLTGATGFVGSHTADQLLGAGHELRALVRASSDPKWLANKGIELVQGNILDPKSLEAAVTRVDAVVHIAGVTASKTKEGFFEGNQLATRSLLEAISTYNPDISHVILGSSLTAVGPSLDGNPVTETTPPHPITTYGKSKLAAEEESKNFKLPVTILRLSAVYGPRDTAILTFFQTVNKRLKPLIGFADKHINLVHVRDVARSVALALEHPNSKGETYLIGSDEQYSWRDVSNLTSNILNKKGVTLRLPHTLVYSVAGLSEFFSIFQKKPSVLNLEKGRDIVQQHWTCSVDKAKREIGYSQTMSLEAGIRETLEWYRQESWL